MTLPSRSLSLLLLTVLLCACTPESYYPAGSDFEPFHNTGGGQIDPGGDRYGELVENSFIPAAEEATSTFSVDADGGSYANLRRFLQQDDALPPSGAIRIEEMINYFDMDYSFGATEEPIALNGEVSGCPWAADHRLVRIGIQGRPLEVVPPSNFVFLVDVSGSMGGDDRLGLLKAGMHRLVDEMDGSDFLSIVTYAGRTAVHLPATSARDKRTLRRAIDRLESGGSTNGGAGIVLAYAEAARNFIPEGNNRVFVGTDGDFNVGMTSHDELIELIEEKRESGVFLTVLGVGRGNYNEATLEQIANKGNGTYEYLDKAAELDQVFFHETGKFYTVAQDVKVQVTFNPELVTAYRLIGYENRLLNEKDFTDDTKDAGEIGAGQNVTALYEIIPAGGPAATAKSPAFTVAFRYKEPTAASSSEIFLDVMDDSGTFAAASDQQRLAGSIAAFGQILRQSKYGGTATLSEIEGWLESVGLPDPQGQRGELLELVRTAESLR